MPLTYLNDLYFERYYSFPLLNDTIRVLKIGATDLRQWQFESTYEEGHP